MYLHETVKFKLKTIELLKRLNSTYPNTTTDFDRAFIAHLLKAVFTKYELKECGRSTSLRSLKRDKLQLAKGIVKLCINDMNILYTRIKTFIRFYLFDYVAVYAVRVGGDKKRYDGFRQIVKEFCQSR